MLLFLKHVHNGVCKRNFARLRLIENITILVLQNSLYIQNRLTPANEKYVTEEFRIALRKNWSLYLYSTFTLEMNSFQIGTAQFQTKNNLASTLLLQSKSPLSFLLHLFTLDIIAFDADRGNFISKTNKIFYFLGYNLTR